MNSPVKPAFVRKDKSVYLTKDLPPRFGNQHAIIAYVYGSPRTGYLTSNGFEREIFSIVFPLINIYLYKKLSQRIKRPFKIHTSVLFCVFFASHRYFFDTYLQLCDLKMP